MGTQGSVQTMHAGPSELGIGGSEYEDTPSGCDVAEQLAAEEVKGHLSETLDFGDSRRILFLSRPGVKVEIGCTQAVIRGRPVDARGRRVAKPDEAAVQSRQQFLVARAGPTEQGQGLFDAVMSLRERQFAVFAEIFEQPQHSGVASGYGATICVRKRVNQDEKL